MKLQLNKALDEQGGEVARMMPGWESESEGDPDLLDCSASQEIDPTPSDTEGHQNNNNGLSNEAEDEKWEWSQFHPAGPDLQINTRQMPGDGTILGLPR
mmetsp:Transcript_85043/g.150618  ORF Transcript_85043/g.150618 Transcript_85043/m.150618 type:complete len:99 (+) Transcript_85043:2-298(+)